MTGKTITGPGWFKVVDPGVVSIQTTADYVFWTMGIVLCLIYCLLLYAWGIALLMKTKIENMGMKCFYAWLLSTILFLACIPQLYGDARFRAAYWPLLLLLIGVTNESPADCIKQPTAPHIKKTNLIKILYAVFIAQVAWSAFNVIVQAKHLTFKEAQEDHVFSMLVHQDGRIFNGHALVFHLVVSR